jgi:hypothetical protein
MIPHPTMRFAWDDEVLRCSQVVLLLLGLTIALLVGGTGLIGGREAEAVSAMTISRPVPTLPGSTAP